MKCWEANLSYLFPNNMHIRDFVAVFRVLHGSFNHLTIKKLVLKHE